MRSPRSSVLDLIRHPIVQAPLSGGVSTPALTIAAGMAGALGFVAAGYRTAKQLGEDISVVRAASGAPFGVNLFVPGQASSEMDLVRAYAQRISKESESLGVEPGLPRWSDDEWEAKLETVRNLRPTVVSFTFGCPERNVIEDLKERGIEVWVTVTEPDEAELSAERGADALVLQGIESGGHRASFEDEDGRGEFGLLALIRVVRKRVTVPLIAAGGICDGYAIAATLIAGARAAQIGSAFLDTTEAGTAQAYRERLRRSGRTALTRAFTGKRARGIVNGFMRRNSARAPAAYPEVHYVTAPVRAAARAKGDSELINLWAGQSYELIDHGLSAAQVIERLASELVEAFREASSMHLK